MTDRPRPAIPTWNVLVTSLEGERERLLWALRPLARFRRGGFPNVLVATVPDPHAFVAAVAAALPTSGALRGALGKVVPIDRTVRFASPADLVDTIVGAVEPLLERLVGRTFFVRVARRGFRGVIDSTAVEGEIGARLVALLEARGDRPRVRFADPDVVVVVETLHDEAGVALLPRELRTAHPFVRVR